MGKLKDVKFINTNVLLKGVACLASLFDFAQIVFWDRKQVHVCYFTVTESSSTQPSAVVSLLTASCIAGLFSFSVSTIATAHL